MGDEGLEDVDAIESFLAERRAMRKAMPDGEAQAYFGRQARVLWRFGLKRETAWSGPDWSKTAAEREAALAEQSNRVVCGFDVKRGALLMASEPFAVFVPPSAASRRCAHCLASFAAAKRCSRCKRASYCSVACQKAAWKVHREECETLPKLLDLLDGDEEEFADCALASRVFRKMNQRDAEDEGEERSIRVDARGAASVHDVVGDEPNDRARRLASALAESRVLAATKQWTEARRDDLVDLLVVCRLTHFTITDTDGDDDQRGDAVAVGCFPHMALLEHSCAPSVTPEYHGLDVASTARANSGRLVEQRFTATRALRVGEFVTRAYPGVDLGADRATRRAVLSRRYGVLCACSRCDAEQHPDAARASLERNDLREAEKKRLKEAQAAQEKRDQEDWLESMDARYADPAVTRAKKIANLQEAQRRNGPGRRAAPKLRRPPVSDDDDDTIAGLP